MRTVELVLFTLVDVVGAESESLGPEGMCRGKLASRILLTGTSNLKTKSIRVSMSKENEMP